MGIPRDNTAYSIVLSGVYKDDDDTGSCFTYTGQGKQDKGKQVGRLSLGLGSSTFHFPACQTFVKACLSSISIPLLVQCASPSRLLVWRPCHHWTHTNFFFFRIENASIRSLFLLLPQCHSPDILHHALISWTVCWDVREALSVALVPHEAVAVLLFDYGCCAAIRIRFFWSVVVLQFSALLPVQVVISSPCHFFPQRIWS